MNIIQQETRTAVLQAIAEGQTITQVAKDFDVSRSTIYTWRETSENMEILKKRIVTNYVTAINAIGNRLEELTDVLWEIAKDELVKPSDRIKALDSLLRVTTGGTSQLVAAEIVAVKEQIEAMGRSND